MRHVRLGSYSIAITLPGTADLLRRKSMRRYCRLWPPPWCRVAGVTGLNCRMPISTLEHLDRIALFERHDRLFPGRPAAVIAAVGAGLGGRRDGAHGRDGHLEQRLERRLDLRLGGLDVHAEGVFLARGIGRRRLL